MYLYIIYCHIRCTSIFFLLYSWESIHSAAPSQVSWGDHATDGDLGAMSSCKDDEILGWRPRGPGMAWHGLDTDLAGVT